MAGFYVIKEWNCEECEGTGRVQNWMWARYWKENQGKHQTMSAEDDVDWFNKTFGLYVKHHWDLPSEEDYCPECEGEITMRKEIPLAEALQSIGALS